MSEGDGRANQHWRTHWRTRRRSTSNHPAAGAPAGGGGGRCCYEFYLPDLASTFALARAQCEGTPQERGSAKRTLGADRGLVGWGCGQGPGSSFLLPANFLDGRDVAKLALDQTHVPRRPLPDNVCIRYSEGSRRRARA